MNQAKIWLVVKPTVGLPLFLGTVLVISLLVHAAVLTQTTWMANFWQGSKPRTTAAAPSVQPAVVASATPMR